MEVSRRRVRNLEPARPLRRLMGVQDQLQHGDSEPQKEAEAGQNEKVADDPMNTVTVGQFYEILKQCSQNQEPAKTKRISYSRDFLIRLADSPVAKKKPEFLPELPVVLEKARDMDPLSVAV